MEAKKTNSGWLAFFVSGIVAIGYGVLAIMLTERFIDILEIIMRVSGICITATGVVFLIAAIVRIVKKLPWALILIEAIALIAAGVASSIMAKETLALLVIIIGIWSAIIGAFMLYVMVRTRDKNLYNRGFYIACAVLSMAFGILLIAHPFGVVQWFIDMSGVIALIFGVIMMMFSFAVRRIDKEIQVEAIESTPKADNTQPVTEAGDTQSATDN